MSKKKGKVAVVGLGYVGLPLALLADKNGYEVIGVDINKNNIEAINAKKAPFEDAEVTEQLQTAQSRCLGMLTTLKAQI